MSRFARRPTSSLLLGIGFVAATAACGSGGPELPPELLVAIAQARPVASASDYPLPPYGAEPGDTLENACFKEAWLNPVAAKFDPAQLEEVCFSRFYNPSGKSSPRVLLISTGALWCSACRAEWGGSQSAPSLLQVHDELGPQGLAVLGLFFQDAAGNPASVQAIQTWAKLFEVDVPFGRDPDFVMGKYARESVQPFNMLVDTTNMQILARFEGDQSELIFSTIRAKLAQGPSPP